MRNRPGGGRSRAQPSWGRRGKNPCGGGGGGGGYNFIVSHVQFIHIVFSTMFIRHMCYFLNFSPSYFYRKNFLHSFLFFCKFSYLDHFYRFICAILFYNFCHIVYPSNGQILRLISNMNGIKCWCSNLINHKCIKMRVSICCTIRVNRNALRRWISYTYIWVLVYRNYEIHIRKRKFSIHITSQKKCCIPEYTRITKCKKFRKHIGHLIYPCILKLRTFLTVQGFILSLTSPSQFFELQEVLFISDRNFMAENTIILSHFYLQPFHRSQNAIQKVNFQLL